MTVQLPPKTRHTPLMRFYALGETQPLPTPSRFPKHYAEPGPAAILSHRNPHHSQSVQPSVPQSPRSQERLDLHSVQALKLAQARAFAESMVQRPKANVTYSEFVRIREKPRELEPVGTKIQIRELRVSGERRGRPIVQGSTVNSQNAPDWFSIPSSCDVSKAPGYDGTLTLLSRINGWITVTPKAKDRSKRIGRYGPFAASDKKYDLHRVSDLTPAWMQTQALSPSSDPFKKVGGFSTLREGATRLFLVDAVPPAKSQFSLGDFRHNVRTREEAETYMSAAQPRPKELLTWKT